MRARLPAQDAPGDEVEDPGRGAEDQRLDLWAATVPSPTQLLAELSCSKTPELLACGAPFGLPAEGPLSNPGLQRA